MPRGTLLDASALIALILRERGWKTIDALGQTGLAMTTSNALLETFEVCRMKNTGLSQSEILSLLTLKEINVVSVEEADAVEGGFIYRKAAEHNQKGGAHVSVSLGDVTLLAVGKRLDAIIVFSDNEWELIDLPGIEIKPFR